MKKIPSIIISLFLFAFPCYAENFYVTNTGGDVTKDGLSLATAWSPTEFNTVGNWGAGVGKVSVGDTVYLDGTITSSLNIMGSGSAGSVITIAFNVGAKLSKAYWGTTSSAAIYASNKSYITIDFGANGIIENTANGDSLANQQVSYGVDISGGSNWEIKNGTIQNIYVHDYNNNSSVSSRGINLMDVSTVSVHGMTLNNAYYGIIYQTNAGNGSTLNFYSNVISACSTGIVAALGNNGTSLDGVNIYNNAITMGLNWYDTPDSNHIDGIHIWGRGATLDQVTNLKIYNNLIGGNPSTHSTSGIFLENEIISPQVYNNITYNTVNFHTDGFIYIKGNATITASNAKVYNNSLIGPGNGIGMEFGNVTGIDVKNNIFSGLDYAIQNTNADTTMSASNYNDFNLTGDQPKSFTLGGVTKTWAEWQAAGYDANSITTDPLLTADYKLPPTSPAKWAGTATGQLSSTDYGGYSWHSPPSIGAYEFRGGVTLGTGAAHQLGVGAAHQLY